jgi:hypothetical protein
MTATENPATVIEPSPTAKTPPEAEITLDVVAADQPSSSRLAGLFSALVSLAMLVAVAWEAHKLDLHGVVNMIPRTAPFWIVFATNYLIQPFSEWLIYRRLWGLPLSGFAALLRKMVSNELLLGYLGEVQFYAWARAKLSMVAAPFGAIKDMTILSALTGNIATLVMLIYAWPFVQSGQLGHDTTKIFMGLSFVLVTSLAILLFRQKLFTLPRRELFIITGVHLLRIAAYVGLTALMWHFALPDQPYDIWLVLATLRMLVSRLPFFPNKDVVFAGLAVLMLGHDTEVSNLLAMVAALLLVTHLAVGTIFATIDLISERTRS